MREREGEREREKERERHIHTHRATVDMSAWVFFKLSVYACNEVVESTYFERNC